MLLWQECNYPNTVKNNEWIWECVKGKDIILYMPAGALQNMTYPTTILKEIISSLRLCKILIRTLAV